MHTRDIQLNAKLKWWGHRNCKEYMDIAQCKWERSDIW